MNRLATKRAEKTSGRERECEFFKDTKT